MDVTKLTVTAEEFKRMNRKANIGLVLFLLSIFGTLFTLGQPLWMSAIGLALSFATWFVYFHYASKVWEQIDRVYGQRMRP